MYKAFVTFTLAAQLVRGHSIICALPFNATVWNKLAVVTVVLNLESHALRMAKGATHQMTCPCA